MIGMTLLGVLARGVISNPAEFGGNTDALIPYLIANHMSPLMAGLTLIGPLAATMSTVSSLLIAASSAVIKDILVHERPALQNDVQRLHRYSHGMTVVLGLLALVFAVAPMDVIVWINMFAFGGLESAFVWVFLMGLFWRKANKTGALWSLVGGTLVYCVCMLLGIKIAGIHQILIGVAVSLACMVVGSCAGKRTDEKILDIYF